MTASLSIDDLRRGFAEPDPGSRPMVRWWWFGPKVERDELDRELRAMADVGLGGVEVSFVYPLEPTQTPLLSAEFCTELNYAAQRAHELGLRFDLTIGSGWSFGGPHISTELAAKKLHWDKREIQPGALSVPVVSPWPGDRLIAAFLGEGTVQEPPEDLVELPISGGVIEVPPGAGPRQVLLAYARPTGQNVKRAAAGAEGPVLDHYSAKATLTHLEHVAEPLITAVGSDLVESVFCDSLEVYGADWTDELLSEFEQRRGYPARPRLYQLIFDGPGAAAFRADYYQTLTELYEENFVTVIQQWAQAHGVRFRIQGYGTPPAAVSSYRFADLYEGEGWGWKEVTQTRWASSAAHLYGLKVVSSETWTWVHSPSFRATPLDLQGEAHEHFLAGINQLIGHGWPYSPQSSSGLGWYFYAAGALDDRNPWWPVMPQLVRYLHRLSWLLRQGDHVADVLLYVPVDDVYAAMGPGIGGTLDLWRETRKHIGPVIPAAIRESGFDFDLIDDEALKAIPPAEAGAVIIPFASALPPVSRQWLDQVRAAGGAVIMVVEDGPDAPGPDRSARDESVAEDQQDTWQTIAVDDLARTLRSFAEPDVILTAGAASQVGVLHRRLGPADVYFLANAGNTTQEFDFAAKSPRSCFEEWDALTGEVIRRGRAAEGIHLLLQPYQATIVVIFDADLPSIARPDRQSGGGQRSLPGPWQLEFVDDAVIEERSVELPHRWEDEPATAHYSGRASYRMSLTADASWFGPDGRARAVLDFGDAQPIDAGSSDRAGVRGNSYRVHVAPPIGEIALITVNGVECGVLWAPPYAVDISEALRPGQNELVITIANTAANALAVDRAIGDLVDRSVHQYGRRFRMQDLDRAMDTVSSGLLAVPMIRWQGPPHAAS